MMSPRALHVTLISHSAGMAGAEISLLEQTLAFRDAGMVPTVIIPRSGPLEDELHREGIPTHRHYFPWMMTAQTHSPLNFALRKALNRLAALLLYAQTRSEAPDIVITNTTVVGVGPFLAALYGAPHLWLAHEVPSQFKGNAGLPPGRQANKQ